MRKKNRLESNALAYAFVTPGLLTLVVFIGVPMVSGIANAFLDVRLEIGRESVFVGFGNFLLLLNDPVFYLSVRNSLVFVFVSVGYHLVIGFILATMLDRNVRGRIFFRTVSLMPWAMSGVAVALVWVWLYHPQFSPLNLMLKQLGLIKEELVFLGSRQTAFPSVLVAHNWRTFPFAFIMILSGLQMIPKELYESADIDGASGFQKFFRITLPQLATVVMTVALLDVMWTFVYFDLPWVMTRGGPVNSTHLMTTYVYETAFRVFNFGKASALSVFILILNLAVAIVYIVSSKKAEAMHE